MSAQLFCRVSGNKSIHHTAYIAVEERIERIQRKTYAVIGHAVLRIVVGPYFFTAVAAADLSAPCFGYTVVAFAQFYII